MEDDDLQRLYVWLDEIPLSRPKRSIARDFSDGVMVAEVVQHFLPKLIELHNYTPANSSKQKMNNWTTLNRKVFSKIGLVVPENVIKGVVDMKPGVAEVVLSNLRQKIEQFILSGGDQQAALAPEPVLTKHGSGPIAAGGVGGGGAVGGGIVARGGVGAGGVGPAARGGQANAPAQRSPIRAEPPRQAQPDFAQVLMEKDQTLMDYQETVDILQVKVRKLEQLVQLKDKRIDELTKKLKQAGIKV